MASRTPLLLITFLIILLIAQTTSSHVPLFADDGNSLDSAAFIEDPIKSQVIYTELTSENDVHYYRFHMEEGERIKLSVQTPRIEDFVPNMILMGPSISPEGILPPNIEVPEGNGALVIPGKFHDKPFYEPFTPSKSFELADIDITAPATGDYYVAVYSLDTGVKYSLVVGYQETFSLTEWIKVPIDVINIHIWEGQSIIFILAPLIASLVIGIALVSRTGMSLLSVSGPGIIAGLLYIGSGAMTLMQMIIALMGSQLEASFIITLTIVLISIVLGVGILKIALKEQFTTSNRVMLVGIGILGIFTWAGILVGPLLAIVSALIPSKE